jgi:hypothetical protein
MTDTPLRRYDLRPFLYNPKWDVQFREIDNSIKVGVLAKQHAAPSTANIDKFNKK